ncbi:carbohydrate-responsive element-binding protein-like isoform X1 [Alosa sapidissima]|uniref:carbohydrate-responsive element-binding protein-like isoform X1 n=1 Tax=Alosa sapidissima TaxID=34773 RepID=UPI001C09A253|nr:carbohydrate-responsive element-binding protein-like isoform X1 [Alosa sapidissima]
MAKVDKMSPKFSEHSKENRLPDSESDSDPEDDPLANVGVGPNFGSVLRSQVIHSGHFMVSSPHSDATLRRRKSVVTDFGTVNKTGFQTYKFGPFNSGSLSIDPTLTRLFECMTLAYSGKIVSPKWKSFKGLRLLWWDKIRLNNGIWRAWFIQYVEKRRNPVCGFVTPLEGLEADAHRKPEAIVLEGNYWKRRIEVVIKEYHKWRIYYKKRLQKNKDGLLPMLPKGPIGRAGLEKWSNQMYQEPDPLEELECFLSDISDTLFTMTQKPSSWGDERHSAYTSNADMIQPGLTPLQPSLDDFMDIPDIFTSYRGQALDQASYADCSYFESSAGGSFPSSGTPTVSTSLLHTDPTQLSQPSLSADRLSTPSSSDTIPGSHYHRQPLTPDMTFDPAALGCDPKFKGHTDYGPQNECGTTSLIPSYAYITPAITMASSTVAQVPNIITHESPYLYPGPCHKYSSGGGGGTVSTSTVITHTGSTISLPGQDPRFHDCPGLTGSSSSSGGGGSGYLPAACALQGYPPAHPPSLPTLPCPSLSHFFSMPQQPSVPTNRGKHKRKSEGPPRGAGSGAPIPTLPQQTSCLAKLLSASTQERKPALSFDAPVHGPKGPRAQSPISLPVRAGSSMATGRGAPQMQMSGHWSSSGPSLSLCHQGAPAGASQGSAVSALLTQGPGLLTPKTEKLSPVKICGTEGRGITVSFPGSSGQTSPTHPLEKGSNPGSPHSVPGHAKTEPNRTETRRITHISAEQKRRFNIKLGFDTLNSVVTSLSSQPSIKISKATTLQKTADYVSKMQQERAQLHEEAHRLREEIMGLNNAISVCQQQLPATGVPITPQRFDHMREKFREYVRAQTLHNWKFWIFSIIIEPLFESYNSIVSTASLEELCRTTLSWLDQHCSLPALRPTVLNSLRLLSTSTSILTDPGLVPDQANQAVCQAHPSHSYTH